MIKPITFCIPTANNEKDYTLLLLESLRRNTQIENHEILIFIDSDNQNTYESLIEKKKTFPNMRIYRNETGYPFGSQRNVSIMFDAAKNDIVCYLQSDMVVGKDLDKWILNDLEDDNTILSFTRIEPPLHPPSPEKIVMDFGIDALLFNMKSFDDFVEKLQKEDRPLVDGAHFAPFALNKKIWFEKMKGFDTQFRCSREDSDFIIRCKLNDINLQQSWKTAVYHFTCISSRGKDWFKENDTSVKIKNELQSRADYQELLRFIRKWGKFGHDVSYFYDIGLVIDLDNYVDVNVLMNIEPFVSNLYLNDEMVSDYLKKSIEFNHDYFSNLRLKYTKSHWNSVMEKFNRVDFDNRIRYTTDATFSNDIILYCKYSDLENNLNESINLLRNIHQVISNTDIGVYESAPFRIEINEKNNKIESLKSLNVDLDNLLKNPPCLFE